MREVFRPPGLRRDLLAALAIAAVGVGLRLLFVSRFPSKPFSDFLALIDFAFRLRDHGLAVPGWHWTQFNPGLPMILSVLLRLSPPSGGMALARAATAVVTGLLPLAPWLLWRGRVPIRTRLLAAGLLALWPGQIFFSGVVAQDNWVLLPAVTLACLAVRRLRSEPARGYPVAAGLLYASAVAIRQEMLVVLLPALLAASFGPRGSGRARREAAVLLLSVVLPLLLLARQRQVATGRFSLSTEHGGLAILGTFLPGAFEPGWIDPRPYVESVDPVMAADRRAYFTGAWRLGIREAARRPWFHVRRMTAQMMRVALRGDGLNLFWSLRMPEALPPELRSEGESFARKVTPFLNAEMAGIVGLFAAALLAGVLTRDSAVLALGACVVLKVVLQALLSPMPRMFVPATALELLAIALAFGLLPEIGRIRRRTLLAVAVAVPALLWTALPPLEKSVSKSDREEIARRAREATVVAPSARPSPGGRGGGHTGRSLDHLAF